MLFAIALVPLARAAGPDTLAVPQAQEASLEGFRYRVVETAGATAGQSLPLIVGLHYSSSRPEAMLAYFDGIDFPARIVLPQGPYPRRDGYSWFPSDYAQQSAERQDAAVDRSVQALSAFVAAVAKQYPTRGKPVVMGISYGGDLAFLLAVRHPQQIQAAFPVAARYLPSWLPAGSACRPHCPPIRALHGEQDTTVPMQPTQHAVEALRALGYDVSLTPYPGVTHDFDARMQRDFNAQAKALLAPSSP